jgi:NADH-quinone oxidoreductase chain G
MMKITINGKQFEAKGPIKILEVAIEHGIHIPTMCYYPKVESFGGCRMCLVQVEGKHRLQASCSLDAEDGMVIVTETPEIVKARKAMLEFMLINHPLDCPTCDKAGECDLQDFSMIYGAAAGRFKEPKKAEPESTRDPLIVRNMERCIMCTKCTRVCAELQGDFSIAAVGRGKHTFIESFRSESFDCEYCGSCIIACPVGSLMSKLHRHNYRPWETDAQSDSICSFCGVGCGVHMQIREDGIQRVIPAESDVNKGILCARGFFGYEYISSPKRLTTPLIRKNGKLTPSSWDEALKLIADKLKSIKAASGSDSIAAIASPKCSIEDNYILQKIMRTGVGTNNIDSISRLGLAGLRRIITGLLGAKRTTPDVHAIISADAVFSVCADPVTEAPVLGVRVRNAFNSGAKVFTLGHAPGLRRHSTNMLQPPHGTEGHVLGAILSSVLKAKKLSGENKEIESIIKKLVLPSPDELKDIIDPEQIHSISEALIGSDNVSLITGRGLSANTSSPWSYIVFAALSYVLDANVYLISEGMNENGLLDMGCEPDTLPGPALLSDINAIASLEHAWDSKLPREPGLSLMEMFESAQQGDLKFLYVMGENPVYNLPDSKFIAESISNLDFMVVQDIFMNEVTEIADVVLPAMTWVERSGTLVNMERRIVHMDALIPGKGKEDWRILSELGVLLGLNTKYKSSSEILIEINSISKLYKNVSTDPDTTRWPYGSPAKNADVLLDHNLLIPYVKNPQLPDTESIAFVAEKTLFMGGTMSRHTDALISISNEPYAIISTALAERNGIGKGDMINLDFGHEKLKTSVKINPYLPDNTVFYADTNKTAGILRQFRYNSMPLTHTPITYAYIKELKKGNNS